MKKKLVLALACRNSGTRLYGKSVQYINIDKKVTILEQLINCIKKIDSVSDIVLGISYGDENKIYKKIAKKKSLKFVYGKESDPLGRLIQCGKKTKATDILRITSECPFPYFNLINKYWEIHKKTSADATFLEDIIGGCGFEIISLSSLVLSHKKCKTTKQSEFSTSYIRKNYKKFNINKFLTPRKFYRKDLRLTVDYPEDLALCRIIYKKFIKDAPLFRLEKIVKFLDKNPNLKNMVKPYAKRGYSTMYKWGK